MNDLISNQYPIYPIPQPPQVYQTVELINETGIVVNFFIVAIISEGEVRQHIRVDPNGPDHFSVPCLECHTPFDSVVRVVGFVNNNGTAARRFHFELSYLEFFTSSSRTLHLNT